MSKPKPRRLFGLSAYTRTLPSGTIQSGPYVVAADGGSDVGAFKSTVKIGSPIQITTPLAGFVLLYGQPITVNWTGGDSTSLVTIYLVSHLGSLDRAISYQGRVSDGTIALTPIDFIISSFGIPMGPDMEIVLEVTPDPSQIPSFAAAGLSLGGQHTWKYSYHFKGVTY